MRESLQVELRAIRHEEHDAWRIAMATGFGRITSAAAAERIRERAGVERTLAAFDGDEIVGTADWFPFEITMPGLRPLAAASVVAVAVVPTHRRRGVMTAIMLRQLADIREAGFPVAILTASEGGIYGRFGYGPATSACTYELDKRVARLARPVAAPGKVRTVLAPRAEEVLPALWDAARTVQTGECSMPPGFWYEHVHEVEWRGVDVNRRFFAVYEHDGVVSGLVDYQTVDVATTPRQRAVEVELLLTSTAEAYEALFDYLLGIDLTTTLRMLHRRIDEPARRLLADQRQLRMTRWTDDLWLRPLDVGRLLASRAYAPGAGPALRLLVHDDLFPSNTGVYTIDADGPSVTGPLPAGEAADLELDVASLGSLVLGGHRFTSLARAGRVIEHTAGAAWRADAMFLPDMEPFASISF